MLRSMALVVFPLAFIRPMAGLPSHPAPQPVAKWAGEVGTDLAPDMAAIVQRIENLRIALDPFESLCSTIRWTSEEVNLIAEEQARITSLLEMSLDDKRVAARLTTAAALTAHSPDDAADDGYQSSANEGVSDDLWFGDADTWDDALIIDAVWHYNDGVDPLERDAHGLDPLKWDDDDP